MTIITENQLVKADICHSAGLLTIDFEDDPSFVRSESVLIDLMQRSIGIIFQNGYHHIGDLPASLGGLDFQKMTKVRLSGHGEGGKEIFLHAPIKFRRNTV